MSGCIDSSTRTLMKCVLVTMLVTAEWMDGGGGGVAGLNAIDVVGDESSGGGVAIDVDNGGGVYALDGDGAVVVVVVIAVDDDGGVCAGDDGRNDDGSGGGVIDSVTAAAAAAAASAAAAAADRRRFLFNTSRRSLSANRGVTRLRDAVVVVAAFVTAFFSSSCSYAFLSCSKPLCIYQLEKRHTCLIIVSNTCFITIGHVFAVIVDVSSCRR